MNCWSQNQVQHLLCNLGRRLHIWHTGQRFLQERKSWRMTILSNVTFYPCKQWPCTVARLFSWRSGDGPGGGRGFWEDSTFPWRLQLKYKYSFHSLIFQWGGLGAVECRGHVFLTPSTPPPKLCHCLQNMGQKYVSWLSVAVYCLESSSYFTFDQCSLLPCYRSCDPHLPRGNINPWLVNM